MSGRDYQPYPFAPTSVVVLLAAPWVSALMLVLHGAYGLAPERAWWGLATGEVVVLVLVALASVYLSGLLGFPWLEGLADGMAVRVSAVALALAQALVLVDAAGRVPGAMVGALAAWGAMLVAAYAVMNALAWLPRGVQRVLEVAFSSVVGVVAGAWLGAFAAGALLFALAVLAFALLPLVTAAEPYLPLVMPPLLALAGGLAGGFLAVRVGRAVLIATEDGLHSSGYLALLNFGAWALALLAVWSVRSPEGVELLASPAAPVAGAAFAVGTLGSLAFTLLRQARLRVRFGRAKAPSGA
jgi:hypothetical protein